MTPKPPDGYGCYGGCGGRLHDICGEVKEEDKSELRRIYTMCASKQPAKAASTAAAGKRKAQDAGLTQEEASPVTSTEIVDLLVNLDITPGAQVDVSAKQKAQEWATIEDREDVVEEMKSDDAEDLTKALAGIHMEEEESLDGEEDGSTSTGGGGSEPPSYADLSQHFGTLENYASGCGLTGASYFVKKAR